ncbi:MAG: glycosyltransferase family 2 protein [Acidimicrobiales bacterium]
MAAPGARAPADQELPLVHIVVLCWNGWEDTRECLESLRLVTYERVTVLVVDNGSTDGTPERVAAGFPEFDLVCNPRNLGFAGGSNVGIRRALAAGADYVALLNNDTVVEDSFLQPLLSALQDPGIGAVSPEIRYHDRPHLAWFSGGAIDWRTGWAYHTPPDPSRRTGPTDTPIVTGCCVVVPRDVFLRVGDFDERFFLIYEDTDWSVRSTRAGYRAVVVPESRVLHKVSASFRRDMPALGTFYFTRNGLLFISKHARRPVQVIVRFLWIWAVMPTLRQARSREPGWGTLALLRLMALGAHLVRRYGTAPSAATRIVDRWKASA